jgi:hypothetical protein
VNEIPLLKAVIEIDDAAVKKVGWTSPEKMNSGKNR